MQASTCITQQTAEPSGRALMSTPSLSHIRGLRALESKLSIAARAGELPEQTDTRALARFYSAVLQGMSAQARDRATRTDLEHIAKNALHAWPDHQELSR